MLTSNLKTSSDTFTIFILYSHFNENTEPGDPFPSDKHCNGIGKLW